jgi:hypothetical protein
VAQSVRGRKFPILDAMILDLPVVRKVQEFLIACQQPPVKNQQSKIKN